MLAVMLDFVTIVLGLFAGILICLELGWRIRRKHLENETANSDAGLGTLASAVYGLMGLLIAFTFSGAATRFEARRALIVQETNAIRNAYMRIDLLPADAQPPLRQDYRDYLDARLAYYEKLENNTAASKAAHARSVALQEKIWSESVAAETRLNSNAVTSLVTAAMNSMIDITTTRSMALETHPPTAIYLALAALVLASSVLAGYSMAKSGQRNWTHMLVYAATIALALYLILDMDYPRIGLIRIDSADHLLVDLRSTMK
jgi:hypothetical protein